MRESKFVEQNKEKWSQFEKDLRDNKEDPQLLRSHLIEITDDLSYSRTFYRNRSVRIYLNGLGQQIYNNIYKNKRNFLKSISLFYKEEIPKVLYFCRKEMLISFSVLILSVLIGVFSSAKDEGFARSILGDSYVNMTLENIKNGDPMGVYKQSGQMEMFVSIAINNLWVSIMVFMAGLIASYGALVIMVRNGIMLGVFMYFFYSRNLASEFNLAVWMHGTIEILTLVVETVAGMLLGRGLVYPGTLSRAKAFSIWGKRGAMLFLSTVPFIVFAAFVESFLTRHTDMPNLLRLLLIVFSFGLMLFYFVLYPLSRFKNTGDTELGIPELKPETNIAFNPNAINSNGQIFLKTIQLFGLKFQNILRFSTLIGMGYFLLFYLLEKDILLLEFKLLNIDFSEMVLRVLTNDSNKFIEMYGNLGLLFNKHSQLTGYIMSALWQASLMYYAAYIFSKSIDKSGFHNKSALVYALVLSFAANILLLGNSAWTTILYVAVSPVVLVLFSRLCFEHGNALTVKKLFDHIRSGLGRISAVLFLFMLAVFIGMIFIISPFAYLAVWMMELNVDLPVETYQMVLKCMMMFVFILLISFCIVFYITQCIYLSFTLNEINEANGLNEGIALMGKSKKAYGIETE